MKQIFVIGVFGLIGCMAWADDGVGGNVGYISRGVRVSLSKSFLRSHQTSDGSTRNRHVEEMGGYGIEYVHVKPRDPGFTAGLHLDVLKHNVQVFSGEGNLTYGLDHVGYGFVGVNLTTITRTGASSVTPGPGLQAGVGANFTQNWGADLGYVLETLKASIGGGSEDILIAGVRLKAHNTF